MRLVKLLIFFLVNVAKYIGNNQINVDGDHPCILEINNNHP
jgi:hypothetical protein